MKERLGKLALEALSLNWCFRSTSCSLWIHHLNRCSPNPAGASKIRSACWNSWYRD